MTGPGPKVDADQYRMGLRKEGPQEASPSWKAGEEFTKIYLLQIKNDPKVPERLGTTKIEEKERTFLFIFYLRQKSRKRDGTPGDVRNLT